MPRNSRRIHDLEQTVIHLCANIDTLRDTITDSAKQIFKNKSKIASITNILTQNGMWNKQIDENIDKMVEDDPIIKILDQMKDIKTYCRISE